MTVGDEFQHERIDIAFMETEFEGSYWESATKFINDNWGANVRDLTSKQHKWFCKILDDCTEKRIKAGK